MRRFDTEVFARVLGDQLRRRRKGRGWTRKELLDHLGLDVSLQTLATYELGTRQIALVRFVEIAMGLDDSALEILAAVWEQLTDDITPLGHSVDLVAASRLRSPKLAPLRGWARCRLDNLPERAPKIEWLSPGALEPLAELCGMDVDELVSQLPRPRLAQVATTG